MIPTFYSLFIFLNLLIYKIEINNQLRNLNYKNSKKHGGQENRTILEDALYVCLTTLTN
jgi:hypothetical protein